jgi:hypothetical protein
MMAEIQCGYIKDCCTLKFNVEICRQNCLDKQFRGCSVSQVEIDFEASELRRLQCDLIYSDKTSFGHLMMCSLIFFMIALALSI